MSLEEDSWRDLKVHLYKVFPYKCMKCYKQNCEIHADHVLPKSKHSSHKYKLDNLQVLCRECNLEKSNKNKIDYRSMKHKRKLAKYIRDNWVILAEQKFITPNMITRGVSKVLASVCPEYKNYKKLMSTKRKKTSSRKRLEYTHGIYKKKDTGINISTSKNEDGSVKTILRKK